MIHSISDGLSMGISFYFSEKLAGGKNNLGIIIFFAIMMHKIPTSLGFGSILMNAHISTRETLMHLGAFTLASPLTTILVYLAMDTLSGDLDEDTKLGLKKYTGCILLLSAGTFLYVSTINVLPDLYFKKNTKDGKTEGDQVAATKRERLGNLTWLLCGLFTPMFLPHGH